MQIIDAFWEKQNLGVSCIEIVIESKDSLKSFLEVKPIIDDKEYVVVKAPVARVDIYEQMAKLGFSYIESSFHFILNVKDAVLSPLQQRMNKDVLYEEMNANDTEILYEELKNGLFETDRIALDSKFTQQQANVRYKNWITTELAKQTQLYKIVYKNNVIGFFTFKEIISGIYYPFLAGLYKDYKTSGLGFTTIRKPIEEVVRRNGKVISTYVSSNNLPIVRAHIQQGFILQDIKNIFVKHNE